MARSNAPMSSRPAAAGRTTSEAARSRLGLSRERILEAALDLLDREGLGGFSMRRLADDLGIGTMTLYGHFRDREELLEGVVDAGAQQISVPRMPGPWREDLRRLMRAIHGALTDHPALVELRLERPLISPGALRLTEAGMSSLRAAGFSRRDAARAYRTLFVYTLGSCAFGPSGRSSAERTQALARLRALSADSFPALADSARQASNAMADDTLFDFGLDCLLDGLEARR